MMIRTTRASWALLWLAVTLLLAGCQARQEYVINPDGSGKVRQSFTMKSTPDLNRYLEDIFSQSTGVTGWKEVSVEHREGKAYFDAMVYFKDLHILQIKNCMPGRLLICDEDDKRKYIVLDYKYPFEDANTSRKALPETDGQSLDEAMAAAQRGVEELVESLSSIGYDDARMEYVFDVPGKVVEAQNFAVLPDGRLSVIIDAKAVRKALREIVRDRELFAELAKAPMARGQRVVLLEEMVQEKLFGRRGPIVAISEGPFAEKFDYATEVAEAETDYARIVIGSGMIPKQWPPEDKKHYLKDVTVNAISKNGKYLKIEFTATLPIKGSMAKSHEVYRILDDQGRTLVPQSGRPRYSQHSYSLSNSDDIKLTAGVGNTANDLKSLKLITGVYRYEIYGEESREDLGAIDFKAGAKASKYDLQITKMKQGKNQFFFEVTAELPPRTLSVLLMDGEKQLYKLDVEASDTKQQFKKSAGSSGSLETLPEKVDVIIVTTDRLEKIEAPYVIENVEIPAGTLTAE